MKVGVGFFTCQQLDPPNDTQSQLYADLRGHVQVAEECGLDSFWLAEHHFAADSYLASALVTAASLAAVTERIEIGCEVAAAFYDPIRLAEDAIAVDMVSRGRLRLGLARSYRREEFEPFGLDPSEVAETSRLEAAVSAVRAAYAGREIAPGTRVAPRPDRAEPRLVLGFHGDPAEEAVRAARLGAVLRTDPSWPLEQVREVLSIYDQAAGLAGEVIVFCYGFVSSHDDPWSVIAEGFGHVRRTYDDWAGRAHEPPDPANVRLLLGDVGSVSREMLRYAELVGERLHLVLRLAYPGMPAARVDEAIRELGAAAAVRRGAA